MKGAGIKTNEELVGNALALFLWAVNEVKKGRAVASVDEAKGTKKCGCLPWNMSLILHLGAA